MVLNYVLLAITGILSITGIMEMIKGGAGRARPFRTIGAVIVFILVLIATLTGMDYVTFKAMIESMFGGK
jgi:cytosine/adenosine deaminase-related metal-dependent hydrolase